MTDSIACIRNARRFIGLQCTVNNVLSMHSVTLNGRVIGQTCLSCGFAGRPFNPCIHSRSNTRLVGAKWTLHPLASHRFLSFMQRSYEICEEFYTVFSHLTTFALRLLALVKQADGSTWTYVSWTDEATASLLQTFTQTGLSYRLSAVV